jgi:hypothetical protein
VLSLTVVASGCGDREPTKSGGKGAIPARWERVYLATALACKNLDSQDARFTPLVVRGPDYTTTIEPLDGCRDQTSGPNDAATATPPWHWHSYLYNVPVPTSGQVWLTPGNQPAATVDAAKFNASHAATIYYVNCSDYYTHCPEGRGFQGRVTSIEYFKDDDVTDAP